MSDADIAATLLNRWIYSAIDDVDSAYLDLLREGNLPFSMERHCVEIQGIHDEGFCQTESLSFPDGSRALRIGSPDRTCGWTKWTALDPLR